LVTVPGKEREELLGCCVVVEHSERRSKVGGRSRYVGGVTNEVVKNGRLTRRRLSRDGAGDRFKAQSHIVGKAFCQGRQDHEDASFIVAGDGLILE
jgi:hypothetical protein